ncbi:MAG: competence/damage-inducible protein A [Terriglobales bacterium]
MNAEIIAIGSELLTPFRQDTNSLYLTGRLNDLGVEVRFKTVVGDNREHITDATRTALWRADIVILMGGLGPTEDDLTREAVATALGLELRRDSELIAKLYARFAARQMKMPPNNERQADVIAGAVLLPNPVGTAPGQWIETLFERRQRIVILLPGPPWELEKVFENECVQRLRDKLPRQFIAARVLKVAMLPESGCDARIAPIYTRHKEVQTTILAAAGDIELQLRARAETEEAAQMLVDQLADELEEELGDFVYSNRGESLPQIVGYYLQMRGATLAVAESCTGGMLGQRITSVNGSSRYFLGGAITYSNDLKTLFAGVPPLMIQAHGAVSREVAAAMAEGIRHDCNATLGLAITGIAGPTGGTEQKPVGLVYHALHDGKNTEIIERKFLGDRDRIRLWATQQALDMVRRKLM